MFWRCQNEILKQQPRQEFGEVNQKSLKPVDVLCEKEEEEKSVYCGRLVKLFAWNHEVMHVEH
jgi:hypothetical protein